MPEAIFWDVASSEGPGTSKCELQEQGDWSKGQVECMASPASCRVDGFWQKPGHYLGPVMGVCVCVLALLVLASWKICFQV